MKHQLLSEDEIREIQGENEIVRHHCIYREGPFVPAS